MSGDAASRAMAARLLPLLDLTSLEETDTPASTRDLCARAVTPFGKVAAVCVLGRNVGDAVGALAGSGVRIATVVNFPHGGDDVAAAVAQTVAAVDAGADEIDVVLPYRAFLAGDQAAAAGMLRAVRAACPGRGLKVILETGAFPDAAAIQDAGTLAVAEGADFLKTSTGKTKPAATPAATRALLEIAAAAQGRIGVKPAGGLRETAAAAEHLALADAILGPDWATPRTFRIGASSLLDALLADLRGGHRSDAAAPSAY